MDTFLSLDDVLDSIDESLFRSIRYNPQHVLHQLLPPPKHIGYNLRSRGHGLTLQSSCAKTLLTACYSMMIYINVIPTGLYFVILLFCMSILYVSLCV